MLPLLDWVGIDIKAAPHGYDVVTGIRDSAHPALTSTKLVAQVGALFSEFALRDS